MFGSKAITSSVKAAVGLTHRPVALPRRPFKCAATSGKKEVEFELPYHTEFGEQVVVVGTHDSLGNWDARIGMPLEWHTGDKWTGALDVEAGSHLEYKYTVTTGEGSVKKWQPGENNTLKVPTDLSTKLYVVDDWTGAEHQVLCEPATSDGKSDNCANGSGPAVACQQER